MTLDDPVALRLLPARVSGRRLLRNDVYETMLEHILDGSLAPGSRLKDAELTEWLQVSRTPVREALSSLAAVGLVRTEPNRYTIVTPLDGGQAADAVVVLRRLYPDAIREATGRLDPDAELEVSLVAAQLERDADRHPIDVFARVLRIALGSLRNEVLAEAIETVHLRLLRHLRMAAGMAEVLKRERVLDFAAALCAGDARAAGIVEAVLDDAERVIAAG